MSHYDTNLDKNAANYVPLTPLSFLERAKDVYPNFYRNYSYQLNLKFIIFELPEIADL